MLFDKLCGVVEAIERLHLPNRRPIPTALASELRKIRDAVKAANVFDFPVVPGKGEWRAKAIDVERELLGELFFLPFQTVAVEDKASCVLLQDLTPEARGLDTLRFFVDCLSLNSPGDMYKEGRMPIVLDGGRDGLLISWGQARLRFTDDSPPLCETRYVCGGVILVSDRIVHAHVLGQASVEGLKGSMVNVQAAVEEIAYFNTPSRWIVEARGAQVRSRDEGSRIRRSHQRPIFTVLEPDEIRKLFGGERSGTREAPAPHPRRRHFRTLRSDRFAKSGLQGKRILIPATWVGPEEVQVGNKRYIVRTDL